MLVRLEAQSGPVWNWLSSNKNGFYDNSIEGVHELSQKVPGTSENVFYFSLSFHATADFPEDWPPLGRLAMESFPTSIELFVQTLLGPIPFIGGLVDPIIRAFSAVGWTILINTTDFRPFVTWVTEDVITRALQVLGYRLVLPNPGKYIPRPDVLPILLPSVYAMGSQELSPHQRVILGPDLEDWYQNDGIVNTASMSGPANSVSDISSLTDFDFTAPGRRGTYWHLGVNSVMDHADEIGVFIEKGTVRRWKSATSCVC
jgi:hypothetical protein